MLERIRRLVSQVGSLRNSTTIRFLTLRLAVSRRADLAVGCRVGASVSPPCEIRGHETLPLLVHLVIDLRTFAEHCGTGGSPHESDTQLQTDRKSTRLNSSHVSVSYGVV